MAHTNNPMPTDLPPAPPVSRRTVPVSGLLVDFYGLDELPADTASVSMLWLHHPRLRSRADMGDIAARCIDAVAQQAEKADKGPKRRHRLVAAAFDQRNHGSRLVSARSNESWREGNPMHAQDMFGTVAGAVADTRLLMDLVDSYGARPAAGSSGGSDATPEGILPGHVAVTQHLMLGVSLGGHSGWQMLFAEPRLTAAVLIIGCPDYMDLMTERARLTKLPTAASPTGVIGSADFPPPLVVACCRSDPRGILFGTAPPVWPAADTPDAQKLHDTLDARLAGKRLLACSGGADKLVPYAHSAAVLDVLTRAAAAWPDLRLVIDDRVYEGIGHDFSATMVDDSVRFIADTVADAPAPVPLVSTAKM